MSERILGIVDWCLPELDPDDVHELWRHRMLVATSIAIVCFAVPLALHLGYTLGRVTPTVAAFIVGSALVAANPLLLRLTRSADLVGAILCLELIAILGTMAHANGGIDSASLLWNPAVPLLAVFLVGPRLSAACAAIIIAETYAFYRLDAGGYELPRELGDDEMTWWHMAGLCTFVGFAGVLAWLYEVLRRRDVDLIADARDQLSATNVDLVHARDQAQAAAPREVEFLANMSHEIRTPLNAVTGMAGLLLQTELDEEQERFAATIQTSSDALLAIIDDVLDFSKIESGGLELERAPFDLRDCIEDALDQVAPLAARKGINLAYLFDRASSGFAIVGDSTRLRQILVNLLGNAVKFTSTGEVFVEVRTVATDDGRRECAFLVRDTGIGIDPARVDALFDSFTQADASTTRRYGGTGLGLAITRRLVEMMGGRIEVESELGAGSTFRFTIVADAAPDGAGRGAAASDDVDQPVLRGKRVLIVDDLLTNRRVLTMHARAWGMFPIAVSTSREALDLIEAREAIDLILLDLQMPELDGIGVARKIHAARGADAPPIVLISSIGALGARHAADRDLFAAVLYKPVKPAALHDTLVGALGADLDASPMRPRRPSGEHRRIEPPSIPLRILLAEDQEVNQLVCTEMLRRLGYTPDVAGDGGAALELARDAEYDIILMDMQMPVMDGLEATRRIRGIRAEADRPWIVAITANATAEDRESCFAAGMNDFVSKPLRLGTLRDALLRSPPGVAATGLIGASAADERARRPATTSFPATLIRELGEDAAAEIIGVFLRDGPGQIETLRDAAGRADGDRVRRVAHGLKGSCGFLGLAGMAEACRQLEAVGREGPLEEAAELIDRLEHLLGEARGAFPELFPGRS